MNLSQKSRYLLQNGARDRQTDTIWQSIIFVPCVFYSDHSDTADAGYEVSCFCILVIERKGVHESDNAMMSLSLVI